MLLYLLGDFVAGDLGISDAGNLLAFVKQLRAALRDKALQRLDERVGFPAPAASSRKLRPPSRQSSTFAWASAAAMPAGLSWASVMLSPSHQEHWPRPVSAGLRQTAAGVGRAK